MSIKRLFDAVERRGDIGRRVAALVLPISNRPRVTSSCAGKIRLCEPGEHTSGPKLASRDDVTHNQTLYTILEKPPPIISLHRKQARTYAIRCRMLSPGQPFRPPSMSALPQKADMERHDLHVRFVPKADSRTAAKRPLFDHLVGAGEQRRWQRNAEDLGGDQIDDQLDFHRLLDR